MGRRYRKEKIIHDRVVLLADLPRTVTPKVASKCASPRLATLGPRELTAAGIFDVSRPLATRPLCLRFRTYCAVGAGRREGLVAAIPTGSLSSR